MVQDGVLGFYACWYGWAFGGFVGCEGFGCGLVGIVVVVGGGWCYLDSCGYWRGWMDYMVVFAFAVVDLTYLVVNMEMVGYHYHYHHQ